MSLRVFLVSIVLCIFAFLLIVDESEGEKVLSRQKRKLVFPQFTTVQLSMCIISQISFIPSHKVAVNTGFTIAYGLPYNSSNFWSPVYWARSLLTSNKTSSILSTYFQKLSLSGDDFTLQNTDNKIDVIETTPENDDSTETTIKIEDEVVTTTEKIVKSKKKKPVTKRDVSASEFYSGIKETMVVSGYHEDCLLKSVCELAKHPMAESTDDNLVYDIVHFILTPSLHKGFDIDTEQQEQKLFETAENLGKSGGNCDLLYEACSMSPLHSISNFIDVEMFE